MKKEIRIHPKANKELTKFNVRARNKTYELINQLEMFGKLNFPEARKITKNIYEIRVKQDGVFRVFYTYYHDDFIYILLAFKKKSQKTPKQILITVQKRLTTINS